MCVTFSAILRERPLRTTIFGPNSSEYARYGTAIYTHTESFRKVSVTIDSYTNIYSNSNDSHDLRIEISNETCAQLSRWNPNETDAVFARDRGLSPWLMARIEDNKTHVFELSHARFGDQTPASLRLLSLSHDNPSNTTLIGCGNLTSLAYSFLGSFDNHPDTSGRAQISNNHTNTSPRVQALILASFTGNKMNVSLRVFGQIDGGSELKIVFMREKTAGKVENASDYAGNTFLYAKRFSWPGPCIILNC